MVARPPLKLRIVPMRVEDLHDVLAIEQVAIGAGSPLGGHSIIDANIRQRYGLIVVGIQRTSGKMEFNPPGDAVMHAGDQLVVLGRADGLRDLEAAAAQATA